MRMCHRGISNYYPENTLGSITETIICPKYLGVEIDIQITKDEQWIIYHDSTLLRLNSIDKKRIFCFFYLSAVSWDCPKGQ